jgi:hypothetical protein
MSNIHNAGPDNETSDLSAGSEENNDDAGAEAENSDSSGEAEEDNVENVASQGPLTVARLAGRSATDPTIKNH